MCVNVWKRSLLVKMFVGERSLGFGVGNGEVDGFVVVVGFGYIWVVEFEVWF